MQRAVELLKSGELVAFPTETVYGLGANALNSAAVDKIFKLKGRPYEDPLIVHIAGPEHLELIAEPLSQASSVMAHKLMKRFWPGPLTLVFKKKSCVPDNVTGGLDTVAVRVPQKLIALALIRNCDFPLAAPSANRFQSMSPTTALDVEKELGSEVLILDGGACEVGVESTVLSFDNDHPVILRHGGVTQESLESVLGVKVKVGSKIKMAPGMMEFHYAPRKPLQVFSVGEFELFIKRKSKALESGALLCFSKAEEKRFSKKGFKSVLVLSPRGRLEEAATRLFGALRELDEGKATRIYALEFPDGDLGVALNDRLKKALHK